MPQIIIPHETLRRCAQEAHELIANRKFAHAESLLQDALRRARAAGYDDIEIQVLISLSACMNGVGRFRAAVEYGGAALKMAQDRHDAEAEFKSLLNMGNATRAQGNLPMAVKVYETAMGVALRGRNDMGAAQAMDNIGQIRYQLGDLRGALTWANRAMVSFARTDAVADTAQCKE